MTYTISMASLVAASNSRPAGYLEDCLAVGTLVNDGNSVAFTKEQYASLSAKYGASRAPATVTSGPGTELKKLLAKVGIVATPNCSCNARARLMDENEAREPGWVEANLDTVVGWLREEATKRKLPFLDAAGRMLVRRAVRNAKRNA